MDDDSFEHPHELRETPPAFLLEIWYLGTTFLISYGWYLVALSLVIIFYWTKIQSYLDDRYKETSEREYAAKCKKDPDLMHKRQIEMEAARKKMQEELDAKAALYVAKMKEKEKERTEQLASSIDVGHKLDDRPTTSTTSDTSRPIKKSYRPEYNPLMGSGGSGGYRPPRRGCPGGGCG